MEEKKLYTIGQMAEICNVTTEQLRHYDKKNILSPMGRGRDNNYRYYTEQQIDDVLLIKELKKTGLSLKSIGVLIKEKDLMQIKNVLEQNLITQRRALYERQKSYDELVDVLVRLNSAMLLISKPPNRNFEIVSVPERPVVSTRYRFKYSAEESFISRYTELLGIAERENIEISRSMYILFHEHYSRQFMGKDVTGDLEIFADKVSSASETAGDRKFGGFFAACATHVGSYRDTEEVYKELEEWAREQGHEVSGVSFQELVVGRTMTGREENWVTKIYLPLDVEDV